MQGKVGREGLGWWVRSLPSVCVALLLGALQPATAETSKDEQVIPPRGLPGKGTHRDLAKDAASVKANSATKEPPKRWSTPGGWSGQPTAAALLPTAATMQAMAETLRVPLVSELVAPPPWAAESCQRWYREGWANCMRLLDQDTRRLLWQSVTWIEDEQIERAKRGARLQGLQLHPDQAKEILAYCNGRASAWAQASNKSCP